MARTARPLLAAAIVLLVFAGEAESPAQTEPLTVYSSLALQGPVRPLSLAVVRGARLALEEAGSNAGDHTIRYVSLDDSTARAGFWTPRQTSKNARRAAGDDSAIAYIGEFSSGASAISIPILNERGVAQISPSNQAIGLTRSGPGADPGEPEKYYPTGRRTYFRIAPNDRVQAGALAVAMRDRGCHRIAVLNDATVYGAGVAAWIRRYARRLGLRIVYGTPIDSQSRHFLRLARRARGKRAQCAVFSGFSDGAGPLFRDLARVLPRAKLFGNDGLAEVGFTDPRAGGVSPKVGRRILVSVLTRVPAALPESGQAVLERYSVRYPFKDPWALYGYESMRLILDGVAAAGPDRSALIDWLGAVHDRESVLGTYGFDRFGDTTLRDYGLYRIRGGHLRWAGTVRAP